MLDFNLGETKYEANFGFSCKSCLTGSYFLLKPQLLEPGELGYVLFFLEVRLACLFAK